MKSVNSSMVSSEKAKKAIKEILGFAGIKINGKDPMNIQVHDDRVYQRILAQGSLGLGEAYVDGWWDCETLDDFFYKILMADLDQKVKGRVFLWQIVKAKIMNLQNRKRSQKVAKEHYDLSTKLYEAFLDPYNQYTCGYWKDAKNLNDAQEQKLDLICKKLELSPDDKVLDIGCGWGGFAKFASERYGCHVTGISISDEQIKYAKKYCKGLPVEIVKADYRDFEGKFDKILVCGMIEHVGYKNYPVIMKKVSDCLNEEGLFLLHTFGNSKTVCKSEAWFDKYIFPNGMIPSITQIGQSTEGLFVVEDWHNFGFDYSLTLKAWEKNFLNNWDKIKEGYDERFYRMWRYYLLSLAGAFGARTIQLWQIVFSKNGVEGGYSSIR